MLKEEYRPSDTATPLPSLHTISQYETHGLELRRSSIPKLLFPVILHLKMVGDEPVQ
jgi:hypothetical protein